jgi:hypothetical protein
MKIKEWIRTGNLGEEPKTTEELLDLAGEILDDACSWDIVGECVFIGEDGKTYVGTVEFHIGEANPAYVEQILQGETNEDE